jgi:hypothetical protein
MTKDYNSWGTRELIDRINELEGIIDASLEDAKKGDNKSIRIPVSSSDAQELLDGGTFEWTFPVEGSASSEWIDVELVGTDEEEL